MIHYLTPISNLFNFTESFQYQNEIGIYSTFNFLHLLQLYYVRLCLELSTDFESAKSFQDTTESLIIQLFIFFGMILLNIVISSESIQPILYNIPINNKTDTMVRGTILI